MNRTSRARIVSACLVLLAGAARAQPEETNVLPVGAVVAAEAPTQAYCAALPVSNGSQQDLRSAVAPFSGARCAKYTVTCPEVDDKAVFGAIMFLWVLIRMPETLPKDRRVPLNIPTMFRN